MWDYVKVSSGTQGGQQMVSNSPVLEAQVAMNCPHEFWEPNLGPLQDLLITELVLQPQKDIFNEEFGNSIKIH